jgi:hypothetical protein
MKKHQLYALVMLLSVSGSGLLSAAYAQHTGDQYTPQDPLNLNNSNYPASNQLNSPPNEPESAYGNTRGIYKQPDGIPADDKNVTYTVTPRKSDN